MKITAIEVDGEWYGVEHLTPETIAEFVTDIQKVNTEKDLNKVLKKYGVT